MIAFFGIFTALAIIAGYIERLVPAPVPVPGIKLGIANVIILLCLYLYGGRAALGVNLLRVLLSGLLFSGVIGMAYAFAGASCSFLLMVLSKRAKIFGVVGVSVFGGVSHNLAQIFLAAAAVWNLKLLYYVPVLILSGIAAGIVTGVIAWYALARLKRIL
jgi:heptaprenyl diphosphate synthase